MTGKKKTAGFFRKRNFTLIELMITLVIIILLAAMLGPLLQRGRARAQYIACASNLKQISLAYLQYINDYQNVPCKNILGREQHMSYRLPYGYDDGRGGGPECYGFPSAVHPYMSSSAKIWRCPSMEQRIQVSYPSNNNMLNEIGKATTYVTVGEGVNQKRYSLTVKNLHVRAVGSIAILTENNFRLGAFKTGVYDQQDTRGDAAPNIPDERIFVHSLGGPVRFSGSQTSLLMTADGSVIVTGAWGKWKTGQWSGSLL